MSIITEEPNDGRKDALRQIVKAATDAALALTRYQNAMSRKGC